MPSDAFMAIEFAQSKGQARQEGKTGVKFADVAGMDQTLVELQEIVEARLSTCLPMLSRGPSAAHLPARSRSFLKHATCHQSSPHGESTSRFSERD